MSAHPALGSLIVDLRELTERLRRECPWDRAQTARTIVPHTIEEAYEVADAARAGDDDKLLDELGDLLFQVVFLAMLLEERGAGDLEAVIRTVRDKLVRRHPHVFAPEEHDAPDSPGSVKSRWEALKAEQENREGLFHELPRSLPALVAAAKAQRRAAAVGFEYPTVDGAFADLADEVGELRAELAARPAPAPETEADPRLEAELGDVLFATVNVARKLNVDPELALRSATQRFVGRVERAAELARAEGRRFEALELEAQDRYFDQAKEEERWGQ